MTDFVTNCTIEKTSVRVSVLARLLSHSSVRTLLVLPEFVSHENLRRSRNYSSTTYRCRQTRNDWPFTAWGPKSRAYERKKAANATCINKVCLREQMVKKLDLCPGYWSDLISQSRELFSWFFEHFNIGKRPPLPSVNAQIGYINYQFGTWNLTQIRPYRVQSSGPVGSARSEPLVFIAYIGYQLH